MEPFKNVTSPAAVIAQADVDTDMILPAQFLLRIDRKGLGNFVFHGARQNKAAPFVLDVAPFDQAKIIIGGERFGIGSSREQAVWSLVDFGIRCVIAPSFGEIFYANCAKNGVLALTLDGEIYSRLKEAAATGAQITIDLETTTLQVSGKTPVDFQIDPHQRETLLTGRDETDLILLEDAADIAAFEERQACQSPWLLIKDDQLSSYFSHIETP